MGSKSLGLNILKCLVRETRGIKWSIIHPNDSTDPRSTLSDFNSFAREHDLDILVAASPQAAKAMLADMMPDIGFVCGWYWLIDSETLDGVRHGLWGAHNSLLPKYRGGSPLVWSILNGDEIVGSTVFRISEGMDDGDILCQVAIKLDATQDISDALFQIEGELISKLPAKWSELISGVATVVKQNEDDATYCGQRNEEDGLVDWTRNACDIHNFVRAQAPPYPCAFTFLGQTRIKLLRTRVFPGTYYGTPGQVLRRNKLSVLISCGNGSAIELMNIRVGSDAHEESPPQVIKSVRGRLTTVPISPEVLS